MPAHSLAPASWKSILLFSAIFILLTAGLTVGIHSALEGNALGADFYVFYKAGRTFFLEHANPYSRAVTEDIQLSVLRRLAEPHEDQKQFSYPPYALVMVLPNIMMEYSWAVAAWIAFNLTGVLSIAFLLFPRSPRWILVSFPLLYHILYGAIVGNFSLPISMILLLFWGYFVIQRGRVSSVQVIAGILLAWSTCKPQSTWLYMIFMLLFCFRHRLYLLLKTFAITLAVLMALTFILQPMWPVDWVNNLLIYAGFTGQNRGINALLGWFFPRTMPAGLANTTLLIVFLAAIPLVGFGLVHWWRGRLDDFHLTIGMALITYLLLPNNSSADQLFLLMPLLLWVLWKSETLITARLVWIFLLVASYLTFFADLTDIYPRPIMTWSLILFVAWAGLLLFRQNQQKQV